MIKTTTLLLIIILSFSAFAEDFKREKLLAETEASFENFQNSLQSEFEPTVQIKKPALAMILSLLVPGAGEAYVGNQKRAYAFFAAEVLLWSSYFGVDAYGKSVEKDAVNYGSNYSGVDLHGRNRDFRTDVSFYQSMDEFNTDQLQNRNYSRVYKKTDENNWDWQGSEANRKSYRKLLLRGRDFQNRAKFAGFAIFANHVISAIHSAFLARNLNKSYGEKNTPLKFNYTYDSMLQSEFFQVRLETKF